MDAFLQTNGFNRDIYVRPPREVSQMGIVMEPKPVGYVRVYSGHLWYPAPNTALNTLHSFKRSK